MKTTRLAFLTAGAFILITTCNGARYPADTSSGTPSPILAGAVGSEGENKLNTLASAPVLGTVRGGAAGAASRELANEMKL